MKDMRKIFALLFCLLLPAIALAGDTGYKVTYDGGTLQETKAGVGIKLYIEGDKVRFTRDGKDMVIIPVASITEISYGQDVHRRVGTAIGLAVFSLGIGALMLLSKSKKHFIGLTWADGDKKGGLVFQADKTEYRGILTGLEGVTGKKAIDSDAMNVKN
jgi:hypothetical protein